MQRLVPQGILRTLVGSLSLLNTTTLQPLRDGPSCPSQPDLSCQVQFENQDTCCFNYPGGHLLQTQFWDTNPAIGPDDSWTIHGLWPDHCDGSFDQSCDPERAYDDISSILAGAGRQDLLDFMNGYWMNYNRDGPSLWKHEWGTHGTCISTLKPDCYANSDPHAGVIDFFDRTTQLFQQLPSYKFLSDAGIVPSYHKSYSRDDIESALKAGHGAGVTIRCRRGTFNEIWYHFNVAGSIQTGNFIPADPVGTGSNCPRSVRYVPKSNSAESSPESFVGQGPVQDT